MRPKEVDWARVDESIGKENRERLSEKRVAVIGVGSLGSEIIRLLAMGGVGKFTILDYERLDPVNVVRHVLGLSWLGEYKVKGMKNFIEVEKNPEVEIFAVVGKAQHQLKLLLRSDLVILCGLGNIQTEQLIASQLRGKVPVLVTGVYKGGVGGEAFLIKAKEGPCYSCFMNYGQTSFSINNPKKRELVYGLDSEELISEPSLVIDINRIATLAAEFALKFLMGEQMNQRCPGVNFIIFANHGLSLGSLEIDKLDPLSSRWEQVLPNPRCLICGKQGTKEQISLANLREQLLKD